MRLLDGRALNAGPESLAEQSTRIGLLPQPGRDLIQPVERSGLIGRGGAGFPTGAKLRAAAARHPELLVVNGAEGEPHSKKDRLLMSTRPHLVLDGALLTARAVRARVIVLYIGEHHTAARAAMDRALAERSPAERKFFRTATAPARYVAGDSNAAVNLVTSGSALPTNTPAAPALVQNVETLAHIALIARSGQSTGTVLVTMAGAVTHSGVLEVETRSTIGDAIARAGGAPEPARAVLLGGYFGAWLPIEQAQELAVDPAALRAVGLSLGCGVIGVLPRSHCPVCETAGIMHYLAGESSAQCGPCFFGLRALADACGRIAEVGTNAEDLRRLQRWTVEVPGRGACKHPDGAVMFLQSALATFAPEFAAHPAHRTRGTA
ncbi:MAG: NADH-ubiquinone oxidoreductase-F iron-sulfur binding region domain-containing protein [Candidatus Dormibacteraceae bacterium]